MSHKVEFAPVAGETVAGARRMLFATWHWGALYGVVAVLLALYRDYGGLSAGMVMPFAVLKLAILLGPACLWGAAIYQKLLPGDRSGRLSKATGKLALASLLVYLLFFLLVFIAALFLILISVILVVASGYTPGNGSGASGSISALEASGAIWLLYALCAAVIVLLVWFGLRLILFGAATVTAGRVVVFRSWGLTGGAVIKIALLCLVLIGSPAILSSLILELTSRMFGQAVMFAIMTVLFQLLFFLLGHSLAAALYRRLGPQAVDAEAVFG